MAELDFLSQLRQEEEERNKLMTLMEQQEHIHRQQQQQQPRQLLMQQQQSQLREQHRAAQLGGGGGYPHHLSGGNHPGGAAALLAAHHGRHINHPSTAAAVASSPPVTSSSDAVDTNALRAETMEHIIALQEAHQQRQASAVAQQQQQQILIAYNELEQLQELEQLRQLEIMMQHQEQQQQQKLSHQLQQQYMQQQHHQQGGGGGGGILTNNGGASSLHTASHSPQTQSLRAQIQRRILEEEILGARSALGNLDGGVNSSAERGGGGGGAGRGVGVGGGGGHHPTGGNSSSGSDVHRLQNILLQQELQSHHLPTYLSFGENTPTLGGGDNGSGLGATAINACSGGLGLGNDDGYGRVLDPYLSHWQDADNNISIPASVAGNNISAVAAAQEAAAVAATTSIRNEQLLHHNTTAAPAAAASAMQHQVPQNHISSSMGASSSSTPPTISSSNGNAGNKSDETIISKFLTVVMSHVPEVTPCLIELIPDVMAGLTSGNNQGTEEDGKKSKLVEAAKKFPTVVDATLNELKNLQRNACLMELEDLYVRVTNCITAIEPYTLKFATGRGGGGGGGDAAAADVFSRDPRSEVYGDTTTKEADQEELPSQYSIMMALTKNRQNKGNNNKINNNAGVKKAVAAKQRKKHRLPKKKAPPTEDTMSIMEMYRMEKKMKRKLARRKLKEEEKLRKQEEEKGKDSSTTTATVIKHNLLSSPYKISNENDEKEDVEMEIGDDVKDEQEDKEEKGSIAVAAEEVASEKAEKVSLSDEEPNEGIEGEKVSSSDNSAVFVELKVPITTSINDKEGDDDDEAAADSAADAATSVQKSVKNSQDIERNEDKSIRLQDGTLLFQPSSPPTFAFAAQKTKNNSSSQSSQSSAKFPSFPSSSVVAVPTLKLKDDAANKDSIESNNDGKTNQDDIDRLSLCAVNNAMSSNGKSEKAPEGGGEDETMDNDDNRADVANVLLGLMGK